MVRISTIRLLLSVAEKCIVHQMDVKSTFLNGALDEEIYVDQPEGYSDGTNRVCLLKKAIYSMKQSTKEMVLSEKICARRSRLFH